MTITFYPHEDDLESSALGEKLETLLEAAERYKAVVLDSAAKPVENGNTKKSTTPREIKASYNWEEIARVLREIRDLPESTPSAKLTKVQHLTKLADIYEVLRGAKMAKLEAVRIALMNEANQLKASATAG